jgi:hypothetical protein
VAVCTRTSRSHALADADAIEHALVGHRAPAQDEIERGKGRLSIVAVNFSVPETGVEREMGERFEGELAGSEGAVRGRDLVEIGRNQNAGRVRERAI